MAGKAMLQPMTTAVADGAGSAPPTDDKLVRARAVLEAAELAALERAVRSVREVAVVAFTAGKLALRCEAGLLKVPVGPGGGESACRNVLRELFGSGAAQVRLLGTAPAVGARPVLEVWMARRMPRDHAGAQPAAVEWVELEDAVNLVGTPAMRDARTLAALHVAMRSDIRRERATWIVPVAVPRRDGPGTGAAPTAPVPAMVRDPVLEDGTLDPGRPVPEQFINENLSVLAFHSRVLALAEDPRVPLLERVRFLAIWSRNIDEFFVVQVGRLKRQVAAGKTAADEHGLTPTDELEAIAIRTRQLFQRAQQLLDAVLPLLREQGIDIVPWDRLSDTERRQATRHFDEQIYPLLTPLAASPAHPFPHIPDGSLCLAATVRDRGSGVQHFAAIRVPDGLPRFVQLAGDTRFVPIEAVIRANLAQVFRGMELLDAYTFRVTRSGEIHYDEAGTPDLLQEIAEEVQKRPYGPVVRLEVERAMPREMRELLLQEFRFESCCEVSELFEADVYEVDRLADLSRLTELAALPVPDLHYPPFRPAEPMEHDRSVFDVLRDRDVLVHHPYDSFDLSVERFLVEAAEDAEVLAIKATVYRTDERSRILDALAGAARRGKEVAVVVELKARADEERNIASARRLQAAGIDVVYGLVGLKTHAKIALVVRRENGVPRRYVHVGTGNLNGVTAGMYTDLSLLSSDPELGADLHDLFNALTGYSAPTAYRRLMVSPGHLLGRCLALIDREVQHARAGRPARIRAKMNGLTDGEIIGALYRAAQAGVEIDLVVRGPCRLRPGVRGLSERIRVVSAVGRFLEHARIFHFHNGGNDEYFIGSAD